MFEQIKLALAARRAANALAKEAQVAEQQGYSFKKTLAKGLWSFLLTTASGIGGVIVEYAIRETVSWFSDPAHVDAALAGFPQGVGLALAPLITAGVRMWVNARKHA